LAQLHQQQWKEELERNGLSFVEPKNNPHKEGVTCPACGTTAPLNNGECSDCGLLLG
jgi:hypothetical protein